MKKLRPLFFCVLLFSTLVPAVSAQEVTFYSETLDADPGWSVEGDWAFGVPLGAGGDPSAGFTGTNVYGYNLAGQYPDNIPATRYLTSSSVDCTTFSQVAVRFRRWLGVENNVFDQATFEVSNNGTDWTVIWENSGTIQDAAWVLVEYDISAIAAGSPTVYLRWGMGGTDGSVTYSGWNVDDVELLGVPDTVAVVDPQFLSLADESVSPRVITLVRSGNTNISAAVNYATMDGSALAGVDFTAVSGQVSFAAGEVSKDVLIPVLNDEITEEDEQFTAQFWTDPGVTNVFLTSTSIVLTILNDDFEVADFPFYDGFESGVFSNYWTTYSSEPEGRIQISSAHIPRSGTNHVLLDRSSSGAFNLNELNVIVDLEGQTNVLLSYSAKHFNDERQSIPAMYTGRVNGDGVAVSTNGSTWYRVDAFTALTENYQDFTLDLDAILAGLGLGYVSNFFIRFQQYDNFPLTTDGIALDEISVRRNNPTVSFVEGQVVLPEVAATVSLPLIRELVLDTAVTVDYVISGGTASNGADYVLAETGSVFFAVGQTTNAITVDILDDLIDEPEETIVIQLVASSSDVVLGSLNSMTVIIEANDGPGRLQLITNQYLVSEGDGSITIPVERVGGTVGSVGVAFATFAGTATAGADYSSVNTNLIFADGVATQFVQVPILEDATSEDPETFDVFLSIPTGGAELGDPVVTTVTITDNELNFFQGFEESPSDTWNYTVVANNGSSATRTTSKSMEGAYSMDLNGSNNSNGDPYLLFDNIMIAGLVNVRVSVAFAAENVDSDDDLYLDISYNDGGSWTSIKLVDGFNNGDVEFGETNALNPTTVSPNPYVVSIPDGNTQIRVRVRFDEKSSSSAHLDHYFVDNVHLYFLAPSQPPTITPIPPLSALVSNELTHTVYADDVDLDLIFLSASNLPPGAGFVQSSFDPPTGTLTFTPDVSQAGSIFTSQVYAVDDDGSVSEDVVITVVDSEVFFVTNSLSVDEDGGLLLIPVVISRDKAADVEIGISGSASVGSGLDATLSSTSFVFSSGGAVTQLLTVALADDDLPESTEEIHLSLTNGVNTGVGAQDGFTISIRDNDSFTLATANLVDSSFAYQAEAQRMLEALRPDVVAMQEFNLANGETYRSYVDRTFGTNYEFYVESTALPNGVISRWPIVESGWWDDSFKSNREYVWARIDLPEGRDLILINVHYDFSGGPGVRLAESSETIQYVIASAFHRGDYIAVCGDLNTVSYGEPALTNLSSIVLDDHQPADQLGDIDTNANRNRRYDYVLPDPRLNSQHIAYVVSGVSFPEGMVFDTTLWTTIPPPSPAQVTDSKAPGMTHQVVIKQFALNQTVTMEVQAGDNGMATPMEPDVPLGTDTVFMITADPYYAIDQITLDGVVVPFTGDGSAYDFTWQNPQKNSRLDITFSEMLAAFGVPHLWLIEQGFTNDFDTASQGDQDFDTVSTWQEYIAGTNPNDSNDYFHVNDVELRVISPAGIEIKWPSKSNRLYRITRTTNMTEYIPVSTLPATPPTNSFIDSSPAASRSIYRISVERIEE